MKSLIDRTYVTAKQMTALWRFVTKVERKFYRPGTFNIAEAHKHYTAGRWDEAEALLAGAMPAYLQPATAIIRANVHHRQPDVWVRHLNAYLNRFELAPVVLAHAVDRIHALGTGELRAVTSGPLVSVIMTAHNSAETIAMAMQSILKQTWRQVELVVVDDASTDGTWSEIQRIAAGDSRVKSLRHRINSGPYVCKNAAIHRGLVTGAYVTCQDADDWAHPQRIEKHLELARAAKCLETASLTRCLRMKPSGEFSRIGEPRTSSPDGAAQIARVSCLFAREFLIETLGSWDCVKFGADSEIVSRAEYYIGRQLPRLVSPSMICLDSGTGLSTDLQHGAVTMKGLSPARKAYKTAYERWHAGIGKHPFLVFPPERAPFARPDVMSIAPERIAVILENSYSQ